ncbi:hypothetical protein REPUB_Repub10bG0020200 [Reevesia pubescens]
MMKEFDDNIPSRAFDNFQFVNFTEIMSKNIASSQKETEFALAVLMKIPSQYKATIELNILGGQKGKVPKRVPLPPPTYDAASHSSDKRTVDRRFLKIADNYNSFDQVMEALANAGLKTCNLIVGIDFTKSNTWTGTRSFNGKILHHIGGGLNPYEQAISIIGKKLAASIEHNLIPCYGFGDASTRDQNVFSFSPDDRFCNGFEEVLSRYREIVPQLLLSGFHYAPVSHPCFELPFEAYPINIYYFLPGPTTFAPVIEMAMTIVEQSVGQYHVLVIIADGQATRSPDTQRGQLSSQEQNTVDAIAQASKLPLSIILIGVGDGPWDMMKEFDDNIPSRAFDNFQFVNFTEIMSKNIAPSQKEAEFAVAALMKIPSQYKATIELNILGGRKGNGPERVPLPPPYGAASFNSSKPSLSTNFQYGSASSSSSKPSHPTRFQPSAPPYPEDSSPVSSAPPPPGATYDSQVCPICLDNSKDMAFGCGHRTCEECSEDLQNCPICRSPIETKIKLYDVE